MKPKKQKNGVWENHMGQQASLNRRRRGLLMKPKEIDRAGEVKTKDKLRGDET